MNMYYIEELTMTRVDSQDVCIPSMELLYCTLLTSYSDLTTDSIGPLVCYDIVWNTERNDWERAHSHYHHLGKNHICT